MDDNENSSNNWSDFIATPPNYSSSPSYGPYSDFNNSWLQPHFQLQPEETSGLCKSNESSNSKTFSPPHSQPVSVMSNHTQQNSNNSFQQFNDYTEIENRTIVISNLGQNITREETEKIFDLKPNSVKNIDFQKLKMGIVTIEYYDLRDALQMKKLKNGIILKGNPIMVSFAQLPKIDDPKKPPNNGTIVVFHLLNGMNDQHIESYFGQFGEIRQIRGTPTKPNQRFIEYFDTRAAEAALSGLSGKYVMGSRVSIEFSLPGGFRRNVQRNLNHM